jgi:hypothetical protein
MKLRQGCKHALVQQQFSNRIEMHTHAHTHTRTRARSSYSTKQHANIARTCSSSSSSDINNKSTVASISSSLWEVKVAAIKPRAAKAPFRGGGWWILLYNKYKGVVVANYLVVFICWRREVSTCTYGMYTVGHHKLGVFRVPKTICIILLNLR